MRKNILALSIAASIGSLAGFANAAVISNGNADIANGAAALASPVIAATTPATPAANALTLNPNGVGHMLVVPYFTTQGAKQTLINLVNTDTTNGKAVKIRYRGASNSDDIFDITVYLSPGDVWTATVTANGNVSRFLTSDTSCTIPFKATLATATGGNFPTGRVRNGDPLQTREGYVEILNTADVPPTRVANGGTAATANALFTATKHGAFAAPSCDATVLNAQRQDLNATAASGNNVINRGYTAPTGGLMANWTIVDLSKNSTSTGSAIAIRATNAGANAAGNIVWFPQTTDAVADADPFTADPLLTTGTFKTTNTTGVAFIGATNQDFPDLSTPYTGAVDPEVQASNVTAALAVSNIVNEYITDGNFSTDWVLSMPTRRYSVAANYAATGAAAVVFNPSLRTNSNRTSAAGNDVRGAAAAPGNAVTSLGTNFGYFTSGNTSWNAASNQICVTPGQIRTFDREENEANVFSVSPGNALSFCGETNVITFNGKTSVLGAALAVSNVTTLDPVDATKWTTGWMSLATPGGTNAGLPVVGFAAVAYSGNNLGGAWAHKTR